MTIHRRSNGALSSQRWQRRKDSPALPLLEAADDAVAGGVPSSSLSDQSALEDTKGTAKARAFADEPEATQ